MRYDVIHELLAAGDDGAPAIVAPGREALTYAGLRAEIGRLAVRLRAAGVSRGDRVAIVLPNGPEMAVAFLAVASCATAVPLNPGVINTEMLQSCFGPAAASHCDPDQWAQRAVPFLLDLDASDNGRPLTVPD